MIRESSEHCDVIKTNNKMNAATGATVNAFLSGMHPRLGEISPVNGTPMELMEGIARLVVGPPLPQHILMVGGHAEPRFGVPFVRAEMLDIGREGDNEMILRPQMLGCTSFTISSYCASVVEKGGGEMKALLIGGSFVLSGISICKRLVALLAWKEGQDCSERLDLQPNLKEERWLSASATSDDGTIVICGGLGRRSCNSTEIRGEDGEWVLSKRAFLNHERCEHEMAEVNGSVFAIGGCDATAACKAMSSVEQWDPRSGSDWSIVNGGNMIRARSNFSLSVCGDNIYVFGGLDVDHRIADGGLEELNACEVMDTRAGRWRALPRMPTRRYGHSSATIGDRILLLGGTDYDGDEVEDYIRQIDLFDPDLNKWVPLPEKITEPRSDFKALSF